MEWAKGLNPVSSVEASLGDSSLEPFGPTFNKAFTSLLGRPSSSRALFKPAGGAMGLEQEFLSIEDAVVGESLLGRLKFTDEALLEEASRYSTIPKLFFFFFRALGLFFFLWGIRVLLLLLLSWGPTKLYWCRRGFPAE